MLNGVTTIFNHKKWVFAYFILGLSFWKLEGAQLAALLSVLIPCVIGANAFDKSQWKKEDV